MAKRSNKRSPQQNKDQAGCMSGLISIFDFRHGRTTRRLLSDRRLMPKNTIASTYPTSEENLLTSSEENEKPTLDLVKTSVKELMEEEMVIEQASTNQNDGDEVALFDSECGSHEKNHKNTEKASNKAAFENLDTTFSRQDSSRKGSQFSDLEPLMKEILMIYQRRNDRQSDVDVGRNWTFSIVEEKLSAAVEVFMNEKLSDGDHEKTRRSKDFIDTFQMLSSNKDLFLKLLQDQNPDITGNEDEKSKLKSMAKLSSLENEASDPQPDAPATRKNRNFFRRRSKSQESISLKGEDSLLHSSRIVILKPNSLHNRMKMENEDRNERIASHFSFMEIKKRLKNVIGKEQKEQRNSEKTVVEGSSGWSSPNRDHFYTERFTKKIERVSKLREPETEQIENDENGDSSRQISSIYIEAKKHLSEMLTGGDEDAKLMIESLPKALGKILSFPEYDSLSPGSSHRNENDHGFVTEKTELSSCGNFLTGNESHPCASRVDLEDESRVFDEVNDDIFVGGIPSTTMEDMSLEGDLQIEKPGNQEEVEVLDVSCEPCSSLETIDDDDNGEIVDIFEEERSPKSLKSDSPEENEFSSPVGSSLAKKIGEPESNPSDKSERPSPISVLEPLFSDNEISPASTISRPIEAAIQPLCIRFEDQETCSRICTENEESAFEYVEAVLLASDLNWDEFEKRWLSSAQILDPSLFDEVEIFSSRPSHDQRLLFDSTNEILKQVCDCYLNFYLQLSFIKQNVKPVPKGENLIKEVWERIELHLKNNYPLSLDRLVKKDLGISKTWMDLRSNSREIVFEIDERIFEDMMDDTLLSLVDDCIHNES